MAPECPLLSLSLSRERERAEERISKPVYSFVDPYRSQFLAMYYKETCWVGGGHTLERLVNLMQREKICFKSESVSPSQKMYQFL